MNPRTMLAALALCLACLPPALAEEPAPAPPADAPSAAPVVEKDPASGVQLTGMMWRLSQTMKGRPVMAVGIGAYRSDIPWSDEDFARAATDLEKLQILSAKNSAPDRALIPFQVGQMFVIAPETREAVNPNLSKLTATDVAGRGVLLADVLARLTPDQQKALGSEAGIPVSALPPELQREVALAFRPPLDIVRYKPQSHTDEDGLPQIGYTHDPLGTLEQPLDWNSTRLRARLRINGVSVRSGDQMGFIGSGMGDLPAFEPSGPWTPYRESGEVPAFIDVPNTFKPSDLTGNAYPQPLGLSGVWTVRQVVEKLAKSTGLTLSVWKPYEEMPVFLGTESLRAGDVLDGLRLALTAAWRKMGGAYYLAWDRAPLGAIERTAREAAAGATEGLRKRRGELQTSPAFVSLAETLPFSEDDPLAPSDAQRASLFGPPKMDAEAGPRFGTVRFSDLTAEQQRFIREQAAQSQMASYGEGGRATERRTMTEDDLTSATLMDGAKMEVSVSVPGHGWVRLNAEDGLLNINRWQLENARRKARPEIAEDEILESAPDEIRAMLKDPKPVTPPSDVRGLVVPTLAPGRLTELAAEMKRHGLNVLFYPALYGGYASLPSSAFPPDPALRGADGLAAAVAAMKPKDIRVVAYLNTLAWQNDEDPVHWLNRHPDWLDVDVLGRGRLAYLKAHPQNNSNMFMAMSPDTHNYVRATEPAVEARLKTLVREVAARQGVSAVAFSAWKPGRSLPYASLGLAMPSLGYAWPDRLAAFQKTGADPADAVTGEDYLPASLRGTQRGAEDGQAAANEAQTALVSRLIDTARAARKDWRVYLVNDSSGREDGMPRPGGASNPAPPKADLTILSLFASDPASVAGKGVLFPVPGKTLAEMIPRDEPMMDAMARVMGGISPIVMYDMVFHDESPLKGRRLPMTLYDFRETPEIITDSLRWVKAP